MKRNDFNKRIEIYSVSPVADGFGGYTTSATLVDRRWAKVEPLGAGTASTEYGLEDANRSVRIIIRKMLYSYLLIISLCIGVQLIR